MRSGDLYAFFNDGSSTVKQPHQKVTGPANWKRYSTAYQAKTPQVRFRLASKYSQTHLLKSGMRGAEEARIYQV
jgi:hypothetical protein